jgi:hypothetical protein
MHPPRSGGARPGASKSSFRDKRYATPILLVDLQSGVRETGLWSASQLILRDAPDDLTLDQDFTGAFSFEDDPACGLFQARAVKLDSARRVLGARFDWISAGGQALIEAMLARRKPDAPDQGPIMKVSITHKTINWSLTGMLLERYTGELKSGQSFRGMIRLERAQEPGMFGATVIRANAERRTLAMKFQELPPETFTLLEVAIKKSITG